MKNVTEDFHHYIVVFDLRLAVRKIVNWLHLKDKMKMKQSVCVHLYKCQVYFYPMVQRHY